MVCSAFSTIIALAALPPPREPSSKNDTTEAWMNLPSGAGSAIGLPSLTMATHEVLVPKSIPTARPLELIPPHSWHHLGYPSISSGIRQLFASPGTVNALG